MSNRQIRLEDIDPTEALSYEPVSTKYKSVQITCAVITYALLSALALLLLFTDSPWWCIAAEAVITMSCVVNLRILGKAYRYKGYALREHDITYRSGVVFPTVTTMPLSRIQQVCIAQNPVSKFFGLCSVDIVNGAQSMSSLNIPGLTKGKAETIKNVITQRLNNNHD